MLLKQSFNIRLVRPWMTACTSITSHCCQVNSSKCPFQLEETFTRAETHTSLWFIKPVQKITNEFKCVGVKSNAMLWYFEYYKVTWKQSDLQWMSILALVLHFRAMRHVDTNLIWTNNIYKQSLLLVLKSFSAIYMECILFLTMDLTKQEV